MPGVWPWNPVAYPRLECWVRGFPPWVLFANPRSPDIGVGVWGKWGWMQVVLTIVETCPQVVSVNVPRDEMGPNGTKWDRPGTQPSYKEVIIDCCKYRAEPIIISFHFSHMSEPPLMGRLEFRDVETEKADKWVTSVIMNPCSSGVCPPLLYDILYLPLM
jgi:hypothetical protein